MTKNAMPRNNNLKVSVAVLAIAMAALVTTSFIGRFIERRHKLEILFDRRNPAGIVEISKPYPGGLGISVTSDPSSFAPGQPFTLIASAHVDVTTQDLRFQWDIPADVELLAGQPVQTFTASSGDTVTSSVTLQVKDTMNHQIHVGVSYPNGESRKGLVVQFNTNPEDLPAKHRKSAIPPANRPRILE